jgi:hypothetical protein
MMTVSAFTVPGNCVACSQLHCADMMRGRTRGGRFCDGGIQESGRDAAQIDDSTNTGKGQGQKEITVQKGTLTTPGDAASMLRFARPVVLQSAQQRS